LARCAAGRWTGGPGLVAVVASGLMGSVSGSAVANTASTGVITIPLMRKAGFSPRFAAGIEAAASTGGQLMPPVMGAGAFIMANYTQVPYLQIIGYAALPALLYFLSIGFFVRVEARRLNIPCQPLSEQSFWQVLKQGWSSLLPIVILVAALVIGFTPTYAGCIAILGVVIASWFSRRPMTLRDILEALYQGARNMTSTALLLVAVGLIVNVVTTTGIGNTFSLMISQWAEGSLLLTLVLIALASLILGMGLPVTASYIVLATLSAPVLYQLIAEQQILSMMQAGNLPEQARALFMLTAPDSITQLSQPMTAINAQTLLATLPTDIKPMLLEQTLSPAMISAALVSAHMIIFWLSQDSNVTPPVCLTAFAAAAIAKTPPMQTGLSAWKLAKGLYIIPLLFAYTPLIGGNSQQTLIIFVTAILGLYALVGVFQGYLETALSWLQRALLLACGILLLWPVPNLWWNALGTVGLVGVFSCSQVSTHRRSKL
ncbi:MAG: TRAP transporter fused permease subunit, partial [Ketobacter sp.]